ncbi:hypothetical protein Hypma_010346 [Hypsizygus marmoreus]|uniref:Ubiquitin-like domain-containing protein n=1 Tax=Hypsizygus marmoreus TaxID=39966 RepID=A0A369JU48_HYPMA|nr:hypothetical protein Hypma_010346 [Hypsizygus marmoreus]
MSSLVELRVELPAYAHSFLIHVPRACTIAEVKQEIFNSCIGGPRADGQRLIWRGRYLVDHENVDELWKSVDEPRILHLAVHPSAWSSSPPEIPPPTQTPNPLPQNARSAYQGPIRSQIPPVPTPTAQPSHGPHPLAYVQIQHQRALAALSPLMTAPSTDGMDMDALRSLSVRTVERHGWAWPTVLDEEFPSAIEGGLKYDRVTIDGQNFLSLHSSSEPPTALQAHALKVLTYTFSLLSLPPSPATSTGRTSTPPAVPIPPHVNQMLRQLGLPTLRVVQNQDQNLDPNRNQIIPALREMPLRPLLAPLMMLLFRTLLLLYFVAPTRKPIFGILILAWMLYEIWRPIHNGLMRGLRRAADNRQQQRPNPPARQQEVAQNPAGEAPRPPQNPLGGAAAANHLDHQAGLVLDALGNQNIASEERILNETPGINTAEPGFGHKFGTLLSLLLTTVHPAVWNRRRVVLRQREGRIRTEANMRNAPPADTEGEDPQNANREQLRTELRAQHSRRPRWVREYMDRVVAADWVDDSD